MRAIFMAFSWTPRRWRGGRVRGRRRRPTVLRVDRPPHLEQRLALAPHACHVPRDVETDRSRCGVAREGQRAVRVEPLDVAVAVALVAEAVAAAEARDVLELLAVLDGILVQALDVGDVGELGKLPRGKRLHLVADRVRGDGTGLGATAPVEPPQRHSAEREGAVDDECASFYVLLPVSPVARPIPASLVASLRTAFARPPRAAKNCPR